MFTLSKRLLVLTVAAAALAAGSNAMAQTRRFNVPSEEAAKSIPEFARQAGVQIIAPVSDLHGVNTPALVGEQDLHAALAKLLTGTGLEVASDNGSTIVLRRARTVVGAEAQVAEEVIVSARKRTERLQDVPIAVTALSGADLNAGQHRRIEELAQLAPSTTIVMPSPHQMAFSIRGLGTNPSNDGLEQSAGVFLDGVYLGRPGMAAMELIDIDQIELLRGPQGTLFGKNTTAGAITITTEAPAFTPQGAVQVTGGNLGYFQAQGTVSGPLVDDVLAGRLTAYLTSRSGWVHDATNDRDLDNIHRDGVRGQLLFTPTQDFRLRLIGEYHEENDANGATVFNSWGATPAAWQKKLAVVGGQIVVSPDGDVTAEDGPQAMRARQAAFTAQADWNLGGGLTLTSITGWRHWSYSSAGDAEGTSADILNGFYKIKDDQFSQELRLATPKDRTVELTAGLYFFGQNQDVDQILEYGSSAAAYLSGISPALLPAYAQASPQIATLLSFNNSRWDVRSKPKERSYALFGQAIWHATPQLDVTLGLRGTYETKNEVVWRPTPVATATGQPITALASQAFAPSSVGVTDRAPSGLLSLNYRFTRDVMAYASVSQGEKAGGVSTTLPASGLGLDSLKVKPEVAQDFEMGIKSQFLDRKVTLNADVFYTRVRDYQATYFQTPQGASAAVQVLTNVGRVETRGVEVEASARPLDGLTLKLAASYNDAFYASYASGPCAAEIGGSSCNLTGRPVAGAPRWITNLSGYYERQLNNRITGYVGGEYSWRSSYYGYLDDSAYARTGDYGLLNLRFGARRDDGRWDLTVWAKNLTNERYAANYISFSSLAPGAYAPFFGDPRTYGVTLRSAF